MTTANHIILRAGRMLRRPAILACCIAAAGFIVGLTACGGSASGILDPLDVDNKDEAYRPVVGEPGEIGVVSIHEIIRHKRGAENEIEIETMFGDEIVVDKDQLLDSSDIVSIEAIAVTDLPGFYKLRLHLTPDGGKLWRKFSTDEIRDDSPSVAFVVDGIVYRTFRPRFLYGTEDSVVVDGPFDEPMALNLEANAIRNFMHFSH